MYLNYYCTIKKVKLEKKPIPNADHCAQIVFEASNEWEQTSRNLSFKFKTALNIDIEAFKAHHEESSMSHEDAVMLVFGNSDIVEEILSLYGIEYSEEMDLKDPLDDLVYWLTKDPEMISLGELIDANMLKIQF